jgi:LysW-gamma-L-lysine carboxypeptidase
MSHSAGPGPTAPELAVAYWNRVTERVEALNEGKEKVWEQVLAALQSFASGSDGLEDWAQMTLGFRLPPGVNPEQMKDILAALAQGVELRFSGGEQAYRSDKNNALVRAFLASIRAEGERPGFVLKTGTSDMNVVGPVWRCPIVAYGPGDSSLDHTPDEHVEVAEWERSVAVLVETLRRLAAPG